MNQKRKWFVALCLMLTTMAWAQGGGTVTVQGQVTDPSNEPLIGVTVLIDGQTTGGTVTDFDGNYSIKAPSDATLKFSYIGYHDQKIAVGGKGVINVTMKEDAEMLEEVVVVGYGTQKKESLTGAVTVVDSKAFESKGALSSPLQALQGQVAGVVITRGSSAPGDESWSMNLRGASSANATDPLVLIDGIASTVNDMKLLNSNDIESINFLKDGSAAIYGSRAAGGVVLITTKKGKEGKLKIEYGGSATLRTVGLMPELETLDQWAVGTIQALTNDGNTNDTWMDYAKLALLYRGQYINTNPNDPNANQHPFGGQAFGDVLDFVFDDGTEWFGSLFGSSWSTNHNLAISGGTERNSYRLSLNYMYDGSPLKYGDNNNQRFTGRFSNVYKFNKALTLESNIAYSRQEQVAPTLVSAALRDNPPQPGLPLFTSNGRYYGWGSSEYQVSPAGALEDGGNNELSVSSISISETLKAKITDWLDANVSFGYNTSEARRKTVQNAVQFYNFQGDAVAQTWPLQKNTYFQQTSSRTDYYSISGYVNGHKTFLDKHNVSLMLGTQYELTDVEKLGAKITDIDKGYEVIKGNGTLSLVDNTGSYNYRTAIMSYFGRLNYDFDSRYLLEFNARYDGSSKFLPENRWDFFWGLSLGWRINQERFLRNVNWISNLKLRASYAEMGNQSGIANYDGYQFYNLKNVDGAYVGADKLNIIRTNGTFASTTRQWERIKNYNLALDFGFNVLKGNLSGTVELFQKRNNNMLVSITYPAVLGDAAPKSNDGKFKSWGWEASATYNGHIGKDIDWHIGGTLTFVRNELTDFGGTTVIKSGYTSTQQGYALKSIFGLRYAGKIQNEEQLQAYMAKYYAPGGVLNGIGIPANLRVGDNMYCDENGDGRLDENDYIYLGSDDPEISYSFNFGGSWKGIDLNVVFQGAANRFIYRGVNSLTVPHRNRFNNFTNASIGNTWSPENPDAYYAPYTMDSYINDYNYQANSRTAQDGRYIRLKEISVGYNLPKKLLDPLKVVNACRIYFTGTDLWEWSKITDGFDPEAKFDADKGVPTGTGRYPFTRNFTFGLNVTF